MTDAPDVKIDANLASRSSAVLVLQRRIPEGYSATPQEHRWHDAPHPGTTASIIDVTEMNIGLGMAAAEELLKSAPPHNDTIYRVILRETVKTERLVR